MMHLCFLAHHKAYLHAAADLQIVISFGRS
jgi:hypothetical protein